MQEYALWAMAVLRIQHITSSLLYGNELVHFSHALAFRGLTQCVAAKNQKFFLFLMLHNKRNEP